MFLTFKKNMLTPVKSIKTPHPFISLISSSPMPLNVYINNKKNIFYIKYSNADFFDVVDYDFLEGKPFTGTQVANGEKVAILSKDTKDLYFGEDSKALGKYIKVGKENYRVNGVIRNVPATMIFSYSNIIFPYTLARSNTDRSYFGDCNAILLGHSKNDLEKIKTEYNQLISKVPGESKMYDKLYSHADTFFETIIRTFFGNGGESKESGFSKALISSGILVLLFMLLPAINLMNINISRIMERSSEIGIRKVFGASSMTLVYQFLIENIILTLIGGLIALIMSFGIISIINSSGIIQNIHLSINFLVLAICLITCFLFGLISGVYPAWRMSRLQIIDALKTK
jgi:putative ABC transport system permease protein